MGGRKKRSARTEGRDRSRPALEPDSPSLPEALTLPVFTSNHQINHIPVLFEPVMQSLFSLPTTAPIVLDATLGEAGHTRGILKLRPDATVIALDRDLEMLDRARSLLEGDGFSISDTPRRGAVHCIHASFAAARSELDRLNLTLDFLLADFGVSMFHFAEAERGFSFRDESLDMRLDTSTGPTAGELLNSLTEEELGKIFLEYGEERMYRAIARRVIQSRPIMSASQLTDIVLSVYIRSRNRSGKRNFFRDSEAARTFQSLRIAVNDEIGQIEALIADIPRILNPGGRAALISFHSLEDRPVKKGFQTLSGESFRILNRKPVVPDEGELRLNPASRSGKLRILERTDKTD